MDVKQKTGDSSTPGVFTRPAKEEVEKARKQKKERKKEKAQLAQSKERDAFTKTHLGETSGLYKQEDGVPYSSHLHPGTISFLKKFRPSAYAQMEADEKITSKMNKKLNQTLTPEAAVDGHNKEE